MLTIQQKAQCVLWYHELKSPTAVQRKFRSEFGEDPPYTNSIKRWFKKFMETGSILDGKRSGRPSIDEETVDAVRVAFHRGPRKSIRICIKWTCYFLEAQFIKFNKQISLWKKLYDFIYFSYFAITFWNVCRTLWTPCSFTKSHNFS